MSQFRTEVLPFPWIPLVIVLLVAVLLYLVGKWVYEYAVWLWYNRPVSSSSSGDGRRKKKKKTTNSKRRRSDDEDEDDSDDNENSD